MGAENPFWRGETHGGYSQRRSDFFVTTLRASVIHLKQTIIFKTWMRNHKKLLSPAKYSFVIFTNRAASPGRVCPTRDTDALTSPSTARGAGSTTKATETGAAGDGPGGGCSISTAQGWGENWREGLAKWVSDAHASVSLAAQGETSLQGPPPV